MNLLIETDELKAELAAIEAESIGWLPLGDGAYLHMGKLDEEEIVITVTNQRGQGELFRPLSVTPICTHPPCWPCKQPPAMM